jgi:hypothetical protein
MTMNGTLSSFVQNQLFLSSHLIRQQFKDPTTADIADVHVLPPNTDVVELATLDLKTNMLELQDVMNKQVAEFFRMPTIAELNSNEPKASSQRNELKQFRHMSHFCVSLGRFAYAYAFDVPEKHVRVELQEQSDMHIDTADFLTQCQKAQRIQDPPSGRQP